MGRLYRYDYLIVGAGFAGSVCAERLASAGKRVLLIDQRDHVGGNAYDYYDEHGILVHKYGAHIFHTNSQEVVDYLSQFTAWRHYEHRVLSSVDGTLLPVPINRTTLDHFKGDVAAARAAMIDPYTRKQWGPYADQLLPTVTARVTTRPDTTDDRYFMDRFQGIPAEGYTRLFERMLDHPNIAQQLGTRYREPWTDDQPHASYGSAWGATDVIFTGPLDEFFDHRFGRLPYRSARFELRTHAAAQYQPVAVVNYPSEEYSFTRAVEFKQLTGQTHASTTLAYEFPMADGEPYWPVPTAASAALANQYRALANVTHGVHFSGRLGTYKYLDMDQTVAQALTLTARLLAPRSVAVGVV